MAEETISEEQIAANYAAMLDSVDFINNATKPDTVPTEDWTAMVEANKEHLRIMVEKDYWTDEDMTAVNDAIGD